MENKLSLQKKIQNETLNFRIPKCLESIETEFLFSFVVYCSENLLII